MPKSPSKSVEEPTAPLVPEPTVAPAPSTETQAAETAVEADVPKDQLTEAPSVEIQLDPDFEDDGDVYVQVAELPDGLDGVEDDRYKVPSNPTKVPAEVAAQLSDTAAVVTTDELKARKEAAE